MEHSIHKNKSNPGVPFGGFLKLEATEESHAYVDDLNRLLKLSDSPFRIVKKYRAKGRNPSYTKKEQADWFSTYLVDTTSTANCTGRAVIVSQRTKDRYS